MKRASRSREIQWQNLFFFFFIFLSPNFLRLWQLGSLLHHFSLTLAHNFIDSVKNTHKYYVIIECHQFVCRTKGKMESINNKEEDQKEKRQSHSSSRDMFWLKNSSKSTIKRKIVFKYFKFKWWTKNWHLDFWVLFYFQFFLFWLVLNL